MRSEIEGLLRAFERHVNIPWERTIAGPEKVWFAIYDPPQERRLRARFKAFQNATEAAGHSWHAIDLTNAFAEWMGKHEYRDAYFERPELLESGLEGFTRDTIERLGAALTADDVDSDSLVVVSGAASLLGTARLSRIIEGVNDKIRGRLMVFFPGEHEGHNYRLLGARDGWSYLAVPIEASNGA